MRRPMGEVLLIVVLVLGVITEEYDGCDRYGVAQKQQQAPYSVRISIVVSTTNVSGFIG